MNVRLERVGKRSFDVLGDGWIDIVVLSFRAGLVTGIAGVVVVLTGGTGLQLSTSCDFDFLDDGFSCLELWHINTRLM